MNMSHLQKKVLRGFRSVWMACKARPRFFIGSAIVVLLFAFFQNCGSKTSGTSTSTAASTTALTLSPSSVVLAPYGTQAFVATGGTGSYIYSLSSGSGSMSSAGFYTAPSAAGTAYVQVTDSNGAVASAVVTISGTTTTTSSSLILSPSSVSVPPNGVQTFTTSGGSGSYTYSVYYGSGAIDATTGYFVAPSSTGTTSVKVYDSSTGYSAYSIVTISTTANTSVGTVQYQAQNGYGTTISRTFPAGTYVCSNSVFGSDPANGYVKGCYVNSVMVVAENASFAVSTTGVVTAAVTTVNNACSYTGVSGVTLTGDNHCLLAQLSTSLNPNISGVQTINGVSANYFYYVAYGSCSTTHFNSVTGATGDFMNPNNYTQCIWGYASGSTCYGGFVHNMGNGYIGFYCAPH